jgi:DNA-binding MarR family transcriptional regulator
MSGDRNDESDRKPAADLSREVWMLMSDLVLDHQRRRQMSEAVGLSFSRTRAVRRVAEKAMSMGDLAAALGIDRPNATVLVDELESQDLVRRRPHPTDRRASWSRPRARARRSPGKANEILGTPPGVRVTPTQVRLPRPHLVGL